MPLFPPVTDTLRWHDLVRQGRAQLPIVAPEWTDQNTSDPGIAILELLSWLVEADSYRSSAVTDRERRLLLALAGHALLPARPAGCLVRLASTAATIPAGLRAYGTREDGTVPLTLVEDVALTGRTIATLAWCEAEAEGDGYRTGCADLTRERSAGRPVEAFGPDPSVGDALVIGLDGALAAGSIDLWFVPAEGSTTPERPAGPGPHHDARTAWEYWDGGTWTTLVAADVADTTAALTREGRVRLTVPSVPSTTLGDQLDGVLAGCTGAWLRCRLAAGRHDTAPLLAASHVDVGGMVAAARYTCVLDVPAGTAVTGAPTPRGALARAVVAVAITPGGEVAAVRFDTEAANPHDPTAPVTPGVDVVAWNAPSATTPGRLVADFVVLGVARGVPDEALELAEPWCLAPPSVWLVRPDGSPEPVRVVPDLTVAGPREYAVLLDPDGVTVRFGDGRCGAVPPAGAAVFASGWWTTPAGVGAVRPPLDVALPPDDRTVALLAGDAASTTVSLVSGQRTGAPAEDVRTCAARSEAALWVHDRLTEAARRAEATSLDDLPWEAVRRLEVPERAVTALDLERVSLATPGTALWRARALPGVDPRLPGLLADGCVTIVLVPRLPVDRPVPTKGLLARVRRELSGARTLGTRVFVVGPNYVRVGVRATLVLHAAADPAATVEAATRALDQFLHPVTGGPGGRGWPFGRAVRRSEVLQVLDGLRGVDRVEGLLLNREPGTGECGDVTLCATQLVLAGTLDLVTSPPPSTR